MVSSVNGLTTHQEDPHIYHWTSQEDQEQFFALIEKSSCIVMGRNTYEHAKDMMKHRPGRLRVILTKNPSHYRSSTISDQLEFTSDQPKILLNRLQERGFQEVLLVGGGSANASFLQEHCIDEVWVTIEPLLFPTGTPLFAEGVAKTKLELLSLGRLNDKGTILLKYNLQY